MRLVIRQPLSTSKMILLLFIIGFTEILYIRCQVTIEVEPVIVNVDETVRLTCRYSGAGPESGVKWFRIGDSEGVIYREQTAPNCSYFSGGSAYNLALFTTTCDKAQNNYTLSFKVSLSDLGTMWCCSYIIGGDNVCLQNANITGATTTTSSPTSSTQCKLELGLGLGLGLGIPCVITCIIVVIVLCTGHTYAHILGLLLGLGLGITFLASCIIIAILISKGNQCELQVGLGLGLGSGIPFVIALIVAVIFMCKGCTSKGDKAKRFFKGLAIATAIVWLVYKIYDCLKARPPEPTSETPEEEPTEPTDKESKTKNKGPVDKGLEDTPKIRPQPQPPQNSNIKDRTQRGISATIDNPPGLPTETPRPSKLAPLPQKQPTVEEEDASAEPKKKRKKKKKKGQMNDGNPDEEMVQLKNTRTMPGDQSDGD